MCSFKNENGAVITYDQVRKAHPGVYPMSLVGAGIRAVMAAVNQGIDSHLEACFVPDRGDSYTPGTRTVRARIHTHTLECKVSSESLPVLLRRLFDLEGDLQDEGEHLASNILEGIGIDDDGQPMEEDNG